MMEESANKENSVENKLSSFEEKLKTNYDSLGKVRITFRT